MKLETFFNKFDQLADTPDAITKMRKLVLRLATTGYLIPTDGSGWVQVSLNEIASARMGKTILKNELTDSGIPVYSAGRENAAWGFIAASDLIFRTGTVVVSARGTIGFPKIPAEPEFISTQTTIAITPTSKEIDSGYFCLQLQTVDWEDITTKTAIPMITVRQVHAIEVRYPDSLAEQKRIVAKVNQLMALFDRLEAQQQKRETRHAALARASLSRFADTPTSANLQFLFHPSYTVSPADLRKSLLTLAVQGKLVPQDPNDGYARELINRAMERRQQTIKAKSLRRKELDESADLIRREDLPSSWCVERLANLVDPENTISYGVLVPGNEVPDGIPFVRAQDLSLSNHPSRPNKTIAPEIEKPYARTRLTGGEILLCVVGSIGKLGIVPDSWAGANIARAVARIKPIPEVLRDYLLLVLQEESVQSYFTSSTRTLAQPTLNVGMIEQTPIPVPPLAEQHRIVAKVDQLMALVGQLETQLVTLRATGANLLQALVAELTTPVQNSSCRQQKAA